MADADTPPPSLRRVLTFWPLVFYGLAVIVGAGIYVALGAVVRRAGEAAPLSFFLAGVAAGLTGLCYAELAGRFPEASGGVAYVRRGFGSDRLAQLVGAMIAASVAIAAASIALGAVHYLVILIPVAPALLIVAMVGGFTLIATLGVRESVGLAAVMGVLEIVGLIAATVSGLLIAPDFHLGGLWPGDLAAWRGVVAGAFIAFFAFIGFETLANLAEEVDTHEYISRAGGGRAVINLMSHDSLEVRREASRSVSNLLSSFRHQAAVIEMGIQALLALVDSDDDECCYHVALSLRKLSPNLKSHPVIIYAGGFQVLFRLIEHSNFNTIKQVAAALRDLCANPDYKVGWIGLTCIYILPISYPLTQRLYL